MTDLDICRDIFVSLEKARAKHKNMNTAHEGYAVILEELDEVWDEVKKLQYHGTDDTTQLRKELLHTAAMCVRAIVDLKL